MNPTNNKRLEILVYTGLWLIAIVLLLFDIMRVRSYTELPLLDIRAVGRLFLMLMPFMVLFALNNNLLIPRLLKRGHYSRYFVSVSCSVAVIWCWQTFQFFNMFGGDGGPGHHGPEPPGPRPLIPLPIFLDVIYDLLIVGVNLAISLLFQQFSDRLQKESIMKENAENQLTYLKAQINPHFYMNMLNNIHGMIDINPAKAQDMVIEMSSLMRYMLYECSRPGIELSAEIGFIKDYLALMRARYPEDMVNIHSVLPETKDVAGVTTPPLLFLVFLENAFKHGISYTSGSFVTVSLSLEDGKVVFRCMNSIHKKKEDNRHEGIGLKNVKRRLDIIYGNNYSLDLYHTDSVYSATLTLPLHETEDTDN